MSLDRFPPELTPQILFEDAHLIVLSKPAGLLSQGEKTGDPNLVDWARGHVGRNYVGLIHRLDRNTSGIMVLAKRTKSAQRLTAALQEGRLERTYLAWAEGSLREPVQWKHSLWKNEAKNLVQVVSPSHPGAKLAILTATPIREKNWKGIPLTLIQYRLETGRSHQIRAQSAREGLPLLGDRKYGAKGDFPRPALHSHQLVFEHPMSRETLRFEAPLPDDMERI